MRMNLEVYGWSPAWERRFIEEGYSGGGGLSVRSACEPARVLADFGQKQRLIRGSGECWGAVSGRLRHAADEAGASPAVGDWVAVSGSPDGDAVIHGVLPRQSRVSRQAAGPVTKEQLIAANVDTLFIVCALNGDFNLRRIERYVIMAWNGGVNPVIVLSKSDLCDDPDVRIAQVEAVAPGVPAIALSAVKDEGKQKLEAYLRPGCTVALTGSSGSGKSTLVNWLLGRDVQETQAVREDDSRGRHTTTHREMFPLPQGAVLIDTPGMRELQLWDEGLGGLSQTFEEIEELRGQCRFQDCTHSGEAGCAVAAAVEDGRLNESRLNSYRKMRRELVFQQRKEAQAAKKRTPAKAAAGQKGRRNAWKKEWEGET